MNEELIEMRGGQPLIDAIEEVGGWNVFANKEGASITWRDHNNLLRNIMADYGANPFMRFDVFPDPTDRNKRVLSVSFIKFKFKCKSDSNFPSNKGSV